MTGEVPADVPERPGATREEHRRALQRLRAKQEIIADVIAGRLPLLEATARFGAALSAGGAAPEDGEGVCRSVIGWVHLALCDWPERAEALTDELERQLQSHLARHGAVCLPCC
jgi:hypothetical protein